ncbi:MAG: hypothetical protein KAI47_04020 [Deltaproteobacteria bacterium]|nr:hypothetical protein [Deltaproteobacteria bacterium]
MSSREIQMIEAEIVTLEGFLQELSDDHFIERLGFEERLAVARQRLDEATKVPRAKLLPITFRGVPVDGSRSIDANFATLAVKSFVEATETVAASQVSGELKGRGRLPGVGERSLRIVDTALGSFGFELALPPPVIEEGAQRELPLDEPDPYARAIETTLALIAEAATDDEEAISDLVYEMHPRAATKVRAFAKVLSDHHALFAAEFEGRRVQFDREEQAQRVVDALKEEDIHEDSEAQEGTLLGVLPESRQFEARLADGRLVRGKVDRNVEDISAFKAKWEDQAAILHFRVITVRANRRWVLTQATSEGEGATVS